MNVNWISVRDALPEKNGSYLAVVKHMDDGTQDVISLRFAEKLYRTNTCFADLDNHPEYYKLYDRPGFYFMCGNNWDAEELEIDSETCADDYLRVTHWMPYPDPPRE